jgi:hypothetical protein
MDNNNNTNNSGNWVWTTSHTHKELCGPTLTTVHTKTQHGLGFTEDTNSVQNTGHFTVSLVSEVREDAEVRRKQRSMMEMQTQRKNGSEDSGGWKNGK